MKTTATCKTCGSEFTYELYPSRAPRQFCGQECKKRGGQKTTICIVCGASFIQPQSRDVRLCSDACRRELIRRGHLLTCPRCGKTVEKGSPSARKRTQYCSLECAIEASRTTRHTIICIECGKERIVKKGNTSAQWCSRKCANVWRGRLMRGAGNPSWRGGHPDYYGPDWYQRKRQARKRDGYQCQCCGKRPGGHHVLDVHHIVPFRLFTDSVEANDPSNLITLCCKCHRKLEFEFAQVERNTLGQFKLWHARRISPSNTLVGHL